MAQIKITPEELRKASEYLDNKLEEMKTEIAALKKKVDFVEGNWEGAAHNVFMESFAHTIYPVLKDTLPDVIAGMSKQLSGAADAIEEADEEIAKSFK